MVDRTRGAGYKPDGYTDGETGIAIVMSKTAGLDAPIQRF
jgi:hypothetical protein